MEMIKWSLWLLIMMVFGLIIIEAAHSAPVNPAQCPALPQDCASCSGQWAQRAWCDAVIAYPMAPPDRIKRCILWSNEVNWQKPMAYDRGADVMRCIQGKQIWGRR